MSLARGASLRVAGWPRGTFRSRARRAAPAWKPLRGFAPCGCWRYHRGHDLKPTRRSRDAPGRSVHRLFLKGYVPNLMTEGQVIRFLLDRGFPISSPAVSGKDRP